MSYLSPHHITHTSDIDNCKGTRMFIFRPFFFLRDSSLRNFHYCAVIVLLTHLSSRQPPLYLVVTPLKQHVAHRCASVFSPTLEIGVVISIAHDLDGSNHHLTLDNNSLVVSSPASVLGNIKRFYKIFSQGSKAPKGILFSFPSLLSNI